MSFSLTSQAIESNLQSTEKFVFIALAHCANDTTSYCSKSNTWRAWPAISTISKLAGVSESSVRRALKSLVSKKCIKIEQRRQNKHRNLSNVYTLFAPLSSEKRHAKKEEAAPAIERNQEPSTVTPTVSKEGVTEKKEGVSVTVKQRKLTNNKKNGLSKTETEFKHQNKKITHFDSKITPAGVCHKTWELYIDMLRRRNKTIADADQYNLQAEFLSQYSAREQLAIVKQSIRSGWLSLHPISSPRSTGRYFTVEHEKANSDQSFIERYRDTSWAIGL